MNIIEILDKYHIEYPIVTSIPIKVKDSKVILYLVQDTNNIQLEENSNLIFIQDSNGFHCISKIPLLTDALNLLEYWSRVILFHLEIKSLEVLEFLNPPKRMFPIVKYTLNPIKDKIDEDQQEISFPDTKTE